MGGLVRFQFRDVGGEGGLFVIGRDVVHVVRLRGFGVGEDFAVFPQKGLERLQFYIRFADELDVLIPLGTRHEVVHMDEIRACADTVHASDSLHEACRVPRRVAVQDEVGSVEVHALCQHLRSDDDVIVILPLAREVGAEVGLYDRFHLLPVLGGDREHTPFVAAGRQDLRKQRNRRFRLGEDDELVFDIVFVRHETREATNKFIELGIDIHFSHPFVTEVIHEFQVFLDQPDVVRVEILPPVLAVAPLFVFPLRVQLCDFLTQDRLDFENVKA